MKTFSLRSAMQLVTVPVALDRNLLVVSSAGKGILKQIERKKPISIMLFLLIINIEIINIDFVTLHATSLNQQQERRPFHVPGLQHQLQQLTASQSSKTDEYDRAVEKVERKSSFIQAEKYVIRLWCEQLQFLPPLSLARSHCKAEFSIQEYV